MLWSAGSRLAGVAAVLAVGVALLGCEVGKPRSAAERPLVAVSLPPLAWMVERLAGDAVRIEVVLPPATAPEGWSPTPTALLAVADAALYFAVGHPAIAFETRLNEQFAARGGETLALTEKADQVEASALDPHLWLDLDLVAATVPRLAAALGRVDPVAAPSFLQAGNDLVAEIEALDASIGTELADRSRDFVVVQHAAWERLLGRYGVQEEAIVREGKEPEPGRMLKLVAVARKAEVPTVFSQKGLADRSAWLIASELDAEVVPLDPLARDWAANLERAARLFAAAMD